MRHHLSISVILVLSSAFVLKAQDFPTSILDGPVLQVDSMSVDKPARPSPAMLFMFSRYPMVKSSNSLFMPEGYESREDRAARINLTTTMAVGNSIDRDLYWSRVPMPPKQWIPVIFAARLFLTNPYGFRDGYVPLMNHSFPFIDAKVPGMAPYDNPYTSDKFPKCIESEFDMATGTYKPVMVDWSEFQKKMSNGIDHQFSQPVPNIPVTPVDRMVH